MLQRRLEDRKRAEEVFRAREHDLRLKIESIPGFMSTNIVIGDRAYLNCLGKTLGDTKDWLMALHAEVRVRLKNGGEPLGRDRTAARHAGTLPP
jgi:hypothetical protein